DKIPMSRDRGGVLMPVQRPPGLRLARAVGRQLGAAGLVEAINYAFVDPDRLALMGWQDPTTLLPLENPLSRQRSALRPPLLPGLLEALATNATRQITDARLFEIGQVFTPHREQDGDRPVHQALSAGLPPSRLP